MLVDPVSKRKLTPKEKTFVVEYLIDLNATAAAKRAGYASKHIGVNAHKLLKKPHIKRYVELAQKHRAARLEIEADRVCLELARIGFSDIRKIASWGSAGVFLNESVELDDDDGAAVSKVVQTKDGEIRVEMHSKAQALLTLGKFLGLEKRLESVDEEQDEEGLDALEEALEEAEEGDT